MYVQKGLTADILRRQRRKSRGVPNNTNQQVQYLQIEIEPTKWNLAISYLIYSCGFTNQHLNVSVIKAYSLLDATFTTQRDIH